MLSLPTVLQQEIQDKKTKIDNLQELLDMQEEQIQDIEKRLANMLVQVGTCSSDLLLGIN